MRPARRPVIVLATLLLSAASLAAVTAPAAHAVAPHATTLAVSQVTPAQRDAAITKMAAYEKLGAPLGPVVTGLKNGGASRQYQKGFILWSPQTGAWVSKGGIRTAYAKLGLQNGVMGYPTSTEGDEGIIGSLWYTQNYQGGVITWHPQFGGHAIIGAFHDRWKNDGREAGLGYAVNDVQTGLKNGGSGQRFKDGFIYSTPKTGVRSLTGIIAPIWDYEGRENSKLGYPITQQYRTANGVQAQDFQHGVIAYNSKNATILTGPISKKYFSVGGYTSVIGFPEEYRETTGLKNGGVTKTFERGAIVWSPANGAFVSKGAIRAAWLKTGAQNGKLGYPTTDEITFTDGQVSQFFERGVIVWSAKKGAVVTVVPPHATR